MKAFQQLGTLPEGCGSSLKLLPGSVGPSMAATAAPLVVLRSIKPNVQAAPLAQHNATAHSGTTLAQGEFIRLLECLSDEFPKPLQHRTLSALQQHSQQGSLDSTPVSFSEFQRGVEVCLLLEGSFVWTFPIQRSIQMSTARSRLHVICTLYADAVVELLDVAEDLFRAIDKSETGEVRASALLLALEIAANRDTSSSTSVALLAALKAFTLPSPLGAEVSAPGSDGVSTAAGELLDRTLRLSDMYDAVFHLVFRA